MEVEDGTQWACWGRAARHRGPERQTPGEDALTSLPDWRTIPEPHLVNKHLSWVLKSHGSEQWCYTIKLYHHKGEALTLEKVGTGSQFRVGLWGFHLQDAHSPLGSDMLLAWTEVSWKAMGQYPVSSTTLRIYYEITKPGLCRQEGANWKVDITFVTEVTHKERTRGEVFRLLTLTGSTMRNF